MILLAAGWTRIPDDRAENRANAAEDQHAQQGAKPFPGRCSKITLHAGAGNAVNFSHYPPVTHNDPDTISAKSIQRPERKFPSGLRFACSSISFLSVTQQTIVTQNVTRITLYR